jgi:hypothetical protein
MSSPVFNFGDPPHSRQYGFSFLETLIDARANAQRQFITDMRRGASSMPLLDAGLQFAEIVANRQRDFGRSLIHQIERTVAARQFPNSRPGEPTPEPPPEGHQSSKRTEAPNQPGALRLTIPVGTPAVAVPLQLRNHRQLADTVALSAIEPAYSGVASIPVELIRFDPEIISVPAQSEASVQVLLRISPAWMPGREYWSEIVLAGAETKRVPLVVCLRPEGAPGREY